LTAKGRLEALFLYDAAADLLEEERSNECWGSPKRRIVLNCLIACYHALSLEAAKAAIRPPVLPSLWNPSYYDERLLDLDLELRNSAGKDS